MSKRIAEYTVGQLADLSGTTVRTLHHYDAIGLLCPAGVGINGYRIYTQVEALRLQEILAYRAVGIPLSDIAGLLSAHHDPIHRLQDHRKRLVQQADDLRGMIAALDDAIENRKGYTLMPDRDLYTPFTKAEQARYETWLVDTYGPQMAENIATSKRAIAKIPDQEHGVAARLRAIETPLVAAYHSGQAADDPALHSAFEAQRQFMADVWGKPCDADALEGLGQLYLAHPDFVARYEQLAPKFSAWLPAAMSAHANRLRADPS